jgi:uncharacterized BrkB/YihY/UPF0761 family membrane protein
MPPLLWKLVRYVLIALGATTMVSAVVNVIGAFQLIEPSDEQSLGITRREFVITYAIIFAVGALLLWLGLRRWRRK